ncbi:gliding motility-associated ABC transporter substrate-binding protein GldG [Sphingobacteriales bacterium UPWRP_1]|nr:gliding motility-associated ABC transporter substrate-binding protein GldG [Sphingobacteriales bacterium TSM_CSS]PSJ71696.1 gliding motility-associated ABC transporter substrate-binding protein GldG [Sphingobacteriales bacterium UPWRP_1]
MKLPTIANNKNFTPPTMTARKKTQSLIQFGILAATFLLVNALAAYFYYRFDLTKEKRFTLTPATKQMLRNLDDVVYVKVFLQGEFPAGFKRLRNATLDMLKEFRAYSGNRVEYEFVDPFEGIADPKQREDIFNQLSEKGLEPRRLVENKDEYSEKIIFPGAMLSYKGRELPANLLLQQLNTGAEETLNNSIALLEYNLANTMQKLQRNTKPSIAFLEGHGELPLDEVRDVMVSLSNYYQIQRLDITKNLYIPNKFWTVIVARPTKKFEEVNKFKLDQYIMNGGKVLWLVENMATDMDSLQSNNGSFLALDYGLNLEDQLFKYGARVNFDLVQDLQCSKIPLAVGRDAFGNARQMELFPWSYFPVITEANPNHPVTKNLSAVLMQFAGTIDTIDTRKNDIKKTVLLTTSPYSRVNNAPIRVDVNDVRTKPNPKDYAAGTKPVAVALDGKFPSLFKNRLDPATLKMIDTLPDVSYREESDYNKMVVISDGDVIRNDYDALRGQTSPLGYYKYTGETFANKDLVLNAIEWLNDDNGIIAARNKDIKLRLLDKPRVAESKLQWQLLNLLLPLALVLLFGLGYNFWRKRRYA